MNTKFYELLPDVEGEKRDMRGGSPRCVIYKSNLKKGFTSIKGLEGVDLFYSMLIYDNYDRVNWNRPSAGIWLYFHPELKTHILEYYIDNYTYRISESEPAKMSRLSKGYAFFGRPRVEYDNKIRIVGDNSVVLSEVMLVFEKWFTKHHGSDRDFIEEVRNDIYGYLTNGNFYDYINGLIPIHERGKLPEIKDEQTYRVMLDSVEGVVPKIYLEEDHVLKCTGPDLLEISDIKISCERFIGRPAIKVSHIDKDSGKESYYYHELNEEGKDISWHMSILNDGLKNKTNIFDQLRPQGAVGKIILKKAYEYYESIEPVEAVFGRRFKYTNLNGPDYSETQIDFGNDSGFYINSYKYGNKRFYVLRPYNLPKYQNGYGVNLNKSSKFNSLSDLIIYVQLKFVGVVGYPVNNTVNVSQFYLSKLLGEPVELKFPFYTDTRVEKEQVKETLLYQLKGDKIYSPYTITSYHVALKNSCAREVREAKNYLIYPEQKEALVNLICSLNHYDANTKESWKEHVNDNTIFEVEIYDRSDVLQISIRRFDEGFVDNWVVNHVLGEVIVENGRFKFYKVKRYLLNDYDGKEIEFDTPLEDILFNDLQIKNIRSYYAQCDILESLCYKRSLKYDKTTNNLKVDKEFSTQNEAIDYLKEKYDIGDIQPK